MVVSTERLAFEVAALVAARFAGVRVPEVHEQVVIDGRPGIVMERSTALISSPPLAGSRGLCGASASLGKSPLREPSIRLEWIDRILARPPEGDALCHGDFHPGQLVYADGEAAVLDWTGAKRGDALFDYARTRVVLAMGELPPGAPVHLRLLAAVGRRLLLTSYTRSYARHASGPVDHGRVRDWEIANLALRLSDNIPGERAYLLRRLRTLEARN